MNRAPWYRPTPLRFPRHVRAGYGFLARWQWFSHRFPRLAAIISRGRVRTAIDRRIWAEIEADAEFQAGIETGRREMEEHRTYIVDLDGNRIMADGRWPLDGEQPYPWTRRDAWVYDVNTDWRYLPRLAR